LIDGALFADGQMHGQMQKRVARGVIEITLQRILFVCQHGMVFGMSVDPFCGQRLQWVDQRPLQLFGIDLTEEATDVLL
jgi:hypothetical protein